MIEMEKITATTVDTDIILRELDAQECIIAGMTPRFALIDSVEKSWEAFVVRIEGRPLAYWGHRPSSVLSGDGHAWMLSTPAIEDHRLLAAATTRHVVSQLLALYRSLLVQVDPQYELAVRWLSWLKFAKVADHPPFILMQRTR